MAAVPKQTVLDIIRAIHEKHLGRTLKEYKIHPHDFMRAVDEYGLGPEYAAAQVCRAELYAEDIVDIADTELDSHVARNRIDARKWYASKIKPGKYGERIDVTVNQSVDIRAAIAEGRKRLTVRDVTPQLPESENANDIDDIAFLLS